MYHPVGYNWSAGMVRSPWTDRPGIARFAPEGWREAHEHRQQKPIGADGIDSDQTATPEIPDAWSRIRKQSWARLLKKIYEADPRLCPQCGSTMKVVAVIEDPEEQRKIIQWAKAKRQAEDSVSVRGPPLMAV